MKRTICALFIGVVAGLLMAALPLWRQHVRVAAVKNDAGTAAIVPEPLLDAFAPARQRGGKAVDETHAAEIADTFSADQCRTSLEAAIATGRSELFCALICRWARLDGTKALAWLDLHPDVKKDVLWDALATWAATGSPECAQYMEREGRSGKPHEAWAFPKTLLQYDLEGAIRLFGNLCIGGEIGQLLDRNDLRPAIRSNADAEAIGAVILTHPEWLEKIPADEPLSLLVALRSSWQEIDPDGWDRWAAAHPEMAERSDNQPVPASIRWLGSHDRASATEQILAEAPPEEQPQQMLEIVRLWAGEDSTAAGEWLDAQPPGLVRDAGAEAYAIASAEDDPQAAFRWAETLTDEAVRRRVERQVFTKWLDADPAGATAWLPTSGWTAAQIQAARDIAAATSGVK